MAQSQPEKEKTEEEARENGDINEVLANRGMRRFWGIYTLIEAVMLMVAGVIAIILAVNGDDDSNYKGMSNAFAIVMGAFVILDGIMRFILVLKRYDKSSESILLVGGFEIALGITLAQIGGETFQKIVVVFLASFLTVIGVLFLIFSIWGMAKKKVGKVFIPILQIFLGAALVALGTTIFVLYYTKGDAFYKFWMIAAGCIFALIGLALAIFDLVMVAKANKKDNPKKKKDKKHDVIEATEKDDKGQKVIDVTPVEEKGDEKKAIESKDEETKQISEKKDEPKAEN